jgi:hypothetical protein
MNVGKTGGEGVREQGKGKREKEKERGGTEITGVLKY